MGWPLGAAPSIGFVAHSDPKSPDLFRKEEPLMTSKTETDVASGQDASIEELRQQVKAVKDDLKDLGRTVKGVAQEKLGDAKQKTTEYYEHGKKKASELEDQVEGYIRQKPLKSVLIAAGAGLLVGFFLTRR
jgi:ElaB/YqjD/DUF883 family membrane-anchored ribosome-binding protein